MTVRTESPAPGVALVVLDEPKVRNALTAETRAALRETLSRLEADDGVRAVVLAGADGNFCAGGDVRTMGETDPAKIEERMSDVAATVERVAAFPRPLIAAVSGHAAGAGVSLACLADTVVADATAQFTFSFLRLALGPDWALSHTLGLRVGPGRARHLILSRGRIDAAEAHRVGLVDELVPDGTAVDAAVARAAGLAEGPAAATAAVKRLLTDVDGIRAALKAEAAVQRERFPHAEHQEAAAAFREKRKADFSETRGE